MKSKIDRFVFLRKGWRVMHRLVVERFASENARGVWIYPRVNKREYDHSLGGFPRFLGDFLGKKYQYKSESVLCQQLISDLVGALAMRFPVTLKEILEAPSSRSGLLSRFNASEASITSGGLSSSEGPVKAAQLGLKLMYETPRSIDTLPYIAWGLALIGWSFVRLCELEQCAFCPRVAEHKSKFCRQHRMTQFEGQGRTASRQFQKYRAGQNAKIFLSGKTSPDRNGERAGLGRAMRNREAMFEIIQPAFVIHKNWDLIKGLEDAIRDCPKTVEKLGGAEQVAALGYHELVVHIREVLRPYRFEEELLPQTLYAFEEWFKCEEQVLRKTRGGGKAAAHRLKKAITLAESGHRQIDIATMLGVQQSTVSTWAKKYPSFKQALEGKDTPTASQGLHRG